jgi:ubiquinone/menaquinone biosynthesis C-methylase UbiE
MDSPAGMANYTLSEKVRDYWSERSATFDQSFAHRIRPGSEFAAWSACFARAIGAAPARVLELACGTGEVTGVLLGLGHTVTALDFAEPMLDRARRKHGGHPRLRTALADAETTMEPDATYDAVVSRHLVWTLVHPEQAFADWFRVLKPGGAVIIVDGDWVRSPPLWRLLRPLVAALDRLRPPPRLISHEMTALHRDIMAGLPFGDGLTFARLAPLLTAAGFVGIEELPLTPVLAAQRRVATLRDRLYTYAHRSFVAVARKPSA